MQDLILKYPKIFKNVSKTEMESCMAFGIECGPGWYTLLDELCSALQWDTDYNNYPQVVADQVKEKYGTLRFYFSTEPNLNMYRNRVSKNKLLLFVINTWNGLVSWYCHRFQYHFQFKVFGKRIRLLPDVWYHKWSIVTEEDSCYEHMSGMISFAETMSAVICENCGNPGKCNEEGYWISCRCDECRVVENKKT